MISSQIFFRTVSDFLYWFCWSDPSCPTSALIHSGTGLFWFCLPEFLCCVLVQLNILNQLFGLRGWACVCWDVPSEFGCELSWTGLFAHCSCEYHMNPTCLSVFFRNLSVELLLKRLFSKCVFVFVLTIFRFFELGFCFLNVHLALELFPNFKVRCTCHTELYLKSVLAADIFDFFEPWEFLNWILDFFPNRFFLSLALEFL